MSIIKKTIKLNNNSSGATISFGLTGNNRLSGYQQEIDNLTEETKDDLINPAIDNEVRKFQYDGDAINLVFFFSSNGSYYSNSFNVDGARFSTTEINQKSNKILNSFFIMDFYNTYDNNTQTKIFTIYNTQILNSETSGGMPISKYLINSGNLNQFYSWYVPKSFINEQTGSTVTAYVKFSFYNAKYGDLTLFYNKDNQSLTTPEKLYFKTLLDLNAMTWIFDYSGTNYPPNATAYQVPFNSTYSIKVNETFNSFDNLQQVYPTGNTFQITGGTYTTV